MFRPELTSDECRSCRVCHGCLAGVHSCCYPIVCATTGQRHDCGCPNPACATRRAAA